MPYAVTTHEHYEQVVSWLQEHVGGLCWSRPIIEWQGRGWAMNSVGYQNVKGHTYLVRIDNERLAVIFALRWS